MAITKKTHLDQIEITRGGAYQIRLALVIDEDGEESDRKWHRTIVWNSDEVDPQFSIVNAHLVSMRASPLPQVQINRLKAIIQAVEGVIGVKQPPEPTLP